MLELLFISVYQTAAGAPADPPQQPQTEQSAEATESSEGLERIRERARRRCRVETVTGSRLGSRVCLSQAEGEALETEARDFLTDHMRIPDNGFRGN